MAKTKKRGARALMVLAGVCVTLATLLTSIDAAAFNKGFYRRQYQKLNTAQTIGVSEEDLMRATDVLLDYCAGKRDDLSLVVEKNGLRTQMFTDQTEVAHMVDVQALFLLMRSVRNGLAVVAVLLMVAAFWLKMPAAGAMKALMAGLGLGLLVPVGGGLIASIDFTWFWTQFHHVFFSNELWLLDPATSVLIQMVPEAFFSAIVVHILVWFAVAMAVWFALAALALRVSRRRKEKGTA